MARTARAATQFTLATENFQFKNNCCFETIQQFLGIQVKKYEPGGGHWQVLQTDSNRHYLVCACAQTTGAATRKSIQRDALAGLRCLLPMLAAVSVQFAHAAVT
jgi:hypothetical protein